MRRAVRVGACGAVVLAGAFGALRACGDGGPAALPPGALVAASPWVRSPGNPVARPGKLHPDGRQELGIADPCVLYDPVRRRWRAWWTNSLGRPAEGGQLVIHHAESADGLAWTVAPEPALATGPSPDDWDHSAVEAVSVVEVPGAPAARRFWLFYCGRNDVAVADPRWYQLGAATSPDGRRYTRLPAAESPYARARTPYRDVEGLVLLGRDAFPGRPEVRDGVVAEPAVVHVDGTFHMWFSSYGVDAKGGPLEWGIGYATSRDGARWTPHRLNPLPSLKRAGVGGSSPSVLWDPESRSFELWFNQDMDEERAAVPTTFFSSLGSWSARSADGVTWSDPFTRGRDFAWDPTSPTERHGLMVGAAVARGPDGLRLYYGAFGDRDVPVGFLTPTRRGPIPSVLTLHVATLAATRSR